MKILGYDYKLVVEEDHDNATGRCHISKQLIRISPDQCAQQKESTILHEIIEALAYHLHLELPSDQHKVIMPLEAALYQVLIDAGVDLSPLTKEIKAKKK
jgi:hypothetical protein